MAGSADFSRLALDAELQRLRRFDDRLRKFEPEIERAQRSTCAFCRPRSQTSSSFQDVRKFERNPMIYAHCADVNIYITRNFAPLEDRVRSLIADRSPDPEHLIAGKTNLEPVLPQAIYRTRHPDRPRLRRFLAQGHGDSGRSGEGRGVARPILSMPIAKPPPRLSDFASWLEKEKLPKATPDFALGRSEISTLANGNRAGRFAAAQDSRDRAGEIKGGARSFCRCRQNHRPEQIADRGIQRNPKRASQRRTN